MTMSKHLPAAEELADYLDMEWRGVSFDSFNERGRARVPNVGVVEFRESSNERAVFVEVPTFKFKCSAREAKKILLALSKLIGSV